MKTFNEIAFNTARSLTAMLDDYLAAGVDPAFDAEAEELERQFAELRLTFDQP